MKELGFEGWHVMIPIWVITMSISQVPNNILNFKYQAMNFPISAFINTNQTTALSSLRKKKKKVHYGMR